MTDKRMTAEELAPFNGEEGRSIYISVKETVFDVTSGADFYGPGNPYGIFAGKEVSRCLGKMNISECDAEANAGYDNLNEEHKKTLDDWEAKYREKYAIVALFAADPHFRARGMMLEP